jgi:ribosomal protein S27AE
MLGEQTRRSAATDDKESPMKLQCLRCGSEKMMPNVPLQDHYGDTGTFSHPAQVEVDGNPQAWIFRETTAGTLQLNICGECGYAELQVGNFQELYERFLRQKQA